MNNRQLPLLLVAALFLAGCASWQAATYRTAGITVDSADVAMKLWAAFVASGHARPEQEAVVRVAYSNYQAAAFILLDNAKIATSSETMEPIISGVVAAQENLIRAVQTFVPSKVRFKGQ